MRFAYSMHAGHRNVRSHASVHVHVLQSGIESLMHANYLVHPTEEYNWVRLITIINSSSLITFMYCLAGFSVCNGDS